jgi:hypothetical protein
LPQPDINRPEKRFDALEAEQRRAKSSAVPLPQVAHPATGADTTPLFRLAGVTSRRLIRPTRSRRPGSRSSARPCRRRTW